MSDLEEGPEVRADGGEEAGFPQDCLSSALSGEGAAPSDLLGTGNIQLRLLGEAHVKAGCWGFPKFVCCSALRGMGQTRVKE